MKLSLGKVIARLTAAMAALMIGGALMAAPSTLAGNGETDWSGRLVDPSKGPFAAGARIYQQNCAACHDGGMQRAPMRTQIQEMTPKAILRALTEGAMQAQGSALSADQKVAVSEYLANRKLADADAHTKANMCKGRSARFDFAEPPAFTGWGFDPVNSHAVPTALAGVNRGNVARLKLKWAFAMPDATRARSQPALAGGAIYLGSHNGTVYALDRKTGCTRWAFAAEAEVRNGLVVSPWNTGDRKAKPLVYFGDVVGNAYAVDAQSGALAWKVSADDHSDATLTASPALHGDTLYVPISSVEENSAAAPNYPCCTFRGSLLALDAVTGKQKWRTWLVDRAISQGKRADGVERLGPSGAAVWNAPLIDAKRGQLVFATSDNYSAPATGMSDSIVALDLATGVIKWHYQALANDMWNVACVLKTSTACPDNPGPDFGFGAGTILAQGSDGKEYVLAGQKSGWTFAVDPDTGKLAWKQRVGRGGVGAGIYFGMAATGGKLFVPVTDQPDGQTYDFPASPGLYALDIATGQFAWRAPADDACAGKKVCWRGLGGAISATPELVLAGSDDGHIRAYDAATGKVLWQDDTTGEVTGVNGVKGHGGAIGGGAAPFAYGGEVFVSSGYSYGGTKMGGNVLLVYGVN